MKQIPDKITILLRDPGVFLTLRQMARAAGFFANVEAYIWQKLEATAAEFRSLRIKPSLDRPAESMSGRDRPRERKGPPQKLSGENVQRLLYLRESENLSVTELSRRFNVGATTIRRILSTRQGAAVRVPVSRLGTNAGRGAESKFGRL